MTVHYQAFRSVSYQGDGCRLRVSVLWLLDAHLVAGHLSMPWLSHISSPRTTTARHSSHASWNRAAPSCSGQKGEKDSRKGRPAGKTHTRW